MNAIHELHGIFDRWRRWYRLRRSVVWASRGLATGLGLAVLFAAYAYFGGRVLAEEFNFALALFGLVGLLSGCVAGLAWPFGGLEAARYFDLVLNLKERVSTAFELEGGFGAPVELFAADQAADALSASRQVHLSRHLPLRLPLRELLLSAALLGISLGIGYFSAESFQRAAQRRQVEQAITEQIENLESQIETIQNNPDLSAEQKQALTEPLDQALESLNQAQTLEEGVSALAEAEQALNELVDSGSEALAQDLEQAGSELSQSGGPLESFGENLAQGNFEQAAQDLRELDPGSLTQAERESLAQQLESTANAVEGSDPALAEQMRQAAQAARQGDAGATEEALQQAAEDLENLQDQVAQDQAADSTAQALQEGQQDLVNAGRQGEGQPGDVAGSQGDQPGVGSGPSGNQGGGSGTGEGDQEQPGGGQEAGNDPIAQDNLPDGTGEGSFVPITPASLGEGDGEWVTLPPSGLEGENVVGQGPSSQGGDAPSTVPYTDVLPAYQNAANTAIDNGSIPLQYRDLIREYFSSLEPE